MKLSQIAGVLGLDETDGVNVVPLTDADVAAASPPQPNRAERRATEQTEKRRKKRHVTRSIGGG